MMKDVVTDAVPLYQDCEGGNIFLHFALFHFGAGDTGG
jgi:hypothetical protein